MTPEELLEICRTKVTAEALAVLREYLPDPEDHLLLEDPDGAPYLEEVQSVWAEMPERLRLEMVDAIEAEIGFFKTRVQRFIDCHVHGALRWEEPLPVDALLIELQAILDDEAEPRPIPEGHDCKWCRGEREPFRRT